MDKEKQPRIIHTYSRRKSRHFQTYSRRKSRKREAEMARFSIGRDDDDLDEGPSNNTTTRISKRPRLLVRWPPITTTTTTTATTNPSLHHHPENDEEVVEDDGVEVEEDEEEEDGSEFEEENHEMGNEGQVAEDGSGEGAEKGGGGSDSVGPSGLSSSSVISVTLTDPDVFDCPICLDALTIPVFQCENGHIACSYCCPKIANKCPSCSWPIGYNRCRAIEKVLESVNISCRNVDYGCKETLPYSKKYEHEISCIYAPCSCPLDNCNFIGSPKNLYAHFTGRHSNSAKSFRFNCLFPVYLEKNQKSLILQEQTEGIIFIINHSSERLGSAVNVMSIGSTLSKKGFYYDIIYREGDSSLKLQSSAESTTEWCVHQPLKKYLLVPSDFIGSCGRVKLEVCIRRHHESSSRT